MSQIAYEWVVETVELDYEDIEDLYHFETYAEVLRHVALYPAKPGTRYDIALTRRQYDATDPEALRHLSYAYIDEYDGGLPFEFDCGKRVPVRFQKQVHATMVRA